METRKRAVDARESDDPKFKLWKSRFKAVAGAFEMGVSKEDLLEIRTTSYRALMEAEGLKEMKDRDFAVPASQIALAVISMAQGNLKESDELFEKGLSSLRTQSDRSCRELYAAGLRSRAMWHERNDDLQSAEACLRESIDILENTATASALQLAYSLADLCFVLLQCDQLEEAETLIHSSLELIEATGQDDPLYDWANMLNQVCMSEHDMKSFIDTFEISVTRAEYKLGSHHPNLIRVLNAYATALKKRGMTEKFEEVQKRLVSV